jgi:adenylate cyclase
MAKIGEFKLDPSPPVRTRVRDVHEIVTGLESMKRGLRSFGAYVPRDLVRTLLAEGREPRLELELSEVTLFFSDVAGFTSIAEGMAPDALVWLMSGYLEEMTGIIGAHGGTVDKFLGDGIMAIWGAPVRQETHAAQACRASLECQRRLGTMREEDEMGRAIAFHTRIGLATGNAVVGNVGVRERMNYTAIGDTVNLAARLESLNKVYGSRILVSELTYVQAAGAVVARPIDVVAVKGKKQGLRVWEPLAMADDPNADACRRRAQRFEEALQAYLGREFAHAGKIYAELQAADAGDEAAALMAERCASYERTPPPADWDGVAVMEHK